MLLLLLLLRLLMLFLMLALFLLFTLFRFLSLKGALCLFGCSLWHISGSQDRALNHLVLTLQIGIFLSILFSSSNSSSWLSIFYLNVSLISSLSTFFSSSLFFVKLEHVNGLIDAELQISFGLKLIFLFLSQISCCLVLFF
jgi:hypothetical protein